LSDTTSAFDASLVDESGQLAKDTNWWGAFVIGLSGTVLIIPLVPISTMLMGPFQVALYIGLTLAGVFLCYCLAELATAMPERTGGLPSYAFETFKPWGKGASTHLGGLSSWGYWLGWFAVAPLNALIAADLAVALFDLPAGSEFDPFGAAIGAPTFTTRFFVAAAFVVAVFLPCYLGIRIGARFASVLGIACMVPLLLIIVMPLFNLGETDFGRALSFNFEATGGWTGATLTFPLVMAQAFIFTWTVLAMEAAACYVAECRDPARDAKIALTAEGLFGLFVYVTLPIMILAVLSTADLNLFDDATYLGLNPATLFTGYTEKLFGDSVFWEWFVNLTIIIALLLSVLNAVMGCSRGLFQNSRDGILPRFFGRVNRHGAPSVAMIFSLICSLALLLIGNPLDIYVFSNVGYLFALSLSLIGYWLYRTKHPEVERPFKLGSWAAPLALLIGVAFLFLWVYGGYNAADYAVATGRRDLYFIGLFLLALWFPLYWWRQLENKRMGTDFYHRVSSDSSKEEAGTGS
jgi:amino acid transporter